MPQAIEEKVDEHAGHKMYDMPKDEAANFNEPLPAKKADKL